MGYSFSNLHAGNTQEEGDVFASRHSVHASRREAALEIGHTASDLHILLFCSPRQGWRGASRFPSLGGYKDTFGFGLDSGRPVAHWEARPRFRFRVRRLFF